MAGNAYTHVRGSCLAVLFCFTLVAALALAWAMPSRSSGRTVGSDLNFDSRPLPGPLSRLGVIALGDYNNDGALDLAGAEEDSVWVGFGDGGGGFGERIQVGTGENATAIASGDLNGDGSPDLAVTFEGDREDPGPGSLTVFRNTGGEFQASAPVEVGDIPVDIVIADLNDDGHRDAAVANLAHQGGAPEARPDYVTVLRGDGTGSLTPQPTITAGDWICYAILEPADYDADGDLDLGLAHCGRAVTILTNDGLGGFSSHTVPTAEPVVSSFAATDPGADGRPGIAYMRRGKGGNDFTRTGAILVVQPAAPAGPESFSFGPPTDTHHSPTFHIEVESSDLNHDGRLDLIAGHGNFAFNRTAQLEVLLGNGSGRFPVATTFLGRPGSDGLYGTSVAVGDIDRDGRNDIVSTTWPSGAFLSTDEPLPECGGEDATIVGRPKRDGVWGSGAAEVVAAAGESDHIKARQRDDVVCGDGGQDFLEGDPGDDALFGGGNDDEVGGGPGADLIRGDGGRDRIAGGPDVDRIDDGPGDDRVRAGSGDDRIDARAGSNRVDCGEGRDVVATNERSQLTNDCEQVKVR